MSAPAIILALALAGPDGLQVLHGTAAEINQQNQMIERLRAQDTGPARPRAPAAPPGLDDRSAVAWRADHLTCASRKGRTARQYQAECAAWAAGQAAREAAR
jgi:hypothetical protein